MRVRKIEKEDWAELSKRAHLIVFNEDKDPLIDRVDFALTVEEEETSMLLTYVTCREVASDTLYWQYGGSFPGTKGTINSLKAMYALLRYCQERYKRVFFYVENKNSAMLKMALKCGFLITGIRNYKNSILVEHLLEF